MLNSDPSAPDPLSSSSPAAQPASGTGSTLWGDSPGLRRLTITAAALTVSAIGLGVLLPSSPDRSTAPAAVTQPTPQALIAPAPPHPAPVAPSFPAPQITTPAAATAAQPVDEAKACRIAQPGAPEHFGTGVVVGFENHDISLARIQVTQQQVGGAIDPAYIDNQRVALRMPNGRVVVFLQPRNLQVHIGDRVTVQSSYRNVNLPCNYVPQLITSDLGPARSAAGPGGGQATPAPATQDIR
jgi:hypothetical protein